MRWWCAGCACLMATGRAEASAVDASSDGEMSRHCPWSRGTVRTSGAFALRVILLPPSWEDLGLQRGVSTSIPSQVFSSPRWLPLLQSRWWMVEEDQIAF
jgi:hypothetical protein